jgi:transcriptional regulator GlxA family with amidase domain
MSQQSSAAPRVVAIFIFDEMEVLDFAGPYEVFNVTGELQDPSPFVVYTVAETTSTVKTRGQLLVEPNYSIETLPPADILIVPGGAGSRALLDKPNVVAWIQQQAPRVEILASVCTGSLLLAKAGLLQGLACTTHHTAIDSLQSLVSKDTPVVAQRYIDHGKIVTAGGISAGIDMSLYLVHKLLGEDALKATTQEMEYAWTPDTSNPWVAEVLAMQENS